MASHVVTSSADAFAGSLASNRDDTTLAPVAATSGGAPHAFNHGKSVGTYHHSYNLAPEAKKLDALQVAASSIADRVSSSGTAADGIGATGTSDIASATILLSCKDLSPLALVGLSVAATFIHSESDASYSSATNAGSLSGDASFGSLEISGAVIGRTLSFSGDAAANTILFHNSRLTITLDQQTFATPDQIDTTAVDIQLNNVVFGGQRFLGEIKLGETSASFIPKLA